MVATEETPVQAQSANSPNSKEVSPTKPEATPEDLKAEAMEELTAGKRHLLVSDIPQAVASLGKACEMLSQQFGETAVECADAYFHYGKALLEMARLESGVLGNALTGVPEDESEANDSQVEDPEKLTGLLSACLAPFVIFVLEEERTDVEDKVDEALEENLKKCEKTEESEKKEEAASAENAEEPMDDGESEGGEESATEDAETEETGSTENEKGEEEKSDDEEEPSNLQLAWEMLELAKVVRTKQVETATAEEKLESTQRLCDTLYVLGEVSLENENYQQAVEDLESCLKKRSETLAVDDRTLAETHYQLGIALGFHQKFEEAEESFKKAISVLELRVKNLKDSKSEAAEVSKEVSELESLIPDIKAKVVDNTEMKEECLRKMKEAKEMVGVGFGHEGSSGEPSVAKTVSSISVKRKSCVETDADAKKARANEATNTNGDSKA